MAGDTGSKALAIAAIASDTWTDIDDPIDGLARVVADWFCDRQVTRSRSWCNGSASGTRDIRSKRQKSIVIPRHDLRTSRDRAGDQGSREGGRAAAIARCENPNVPNLDPSDPVVRGMQAQLARRDGELAGGASQVGWKIGFNTPAIQQHFGLNQPVVGYLLERAVTPEGSTVELAGWASPAVEVEVAVRVGEFISGSPTVAGLAPALELVDLGISFDDIEPVLASNICQRGVVFGDEVAGLDPFSVTVGVTKNGEPAGKGALLEDPALTAVFVAQFLAAHGAALEPGQRIIAGSLTAPVAVAPGDALSATFGPLGALSVRFS
jgi:2-keto-4-pentenoate hydratase